MGCFSDPFVGNSHPTEENRGRRVTMTRTTTKERKVPRRRDLEEEDDVLERDEEPEDDEGGDEEEESRDNGGSSGGVFAELKNVASDAALAVLAPVAKKAATGA